ncbi:thymidine phosphorylase [Actinopolyspora saharensis]|uniref:Thymidine phosphorylase n=1 Tax=Actinopolyspora saharensis TaxID=995062 RepID=A0A1H1GSU1_9ACTN|nr:thymidine phosphorylase [Actinopolyspora saharensis]SDR16221.1 thymidine phosphorylase [Actinopolyspora saharensis]
MQHTAHTAVEIIRAKRDGHRLSAERISWVLDAYTRGEVAEEQMSALAMAILLQGMDERETADWTRAMVDSGEVVDLAGLERPTVDKHSTGGVGDKITLVLTPLVAACGAAVPQLSGRGLGHTGGTLDKLESLPGWRARLSAAELRRNLEEVGAVICAADERIAPADRKLYALRDVTGTVESIPLIASSIMSKKKAEGTDALVLDVKCGSGAFVQQRAEAALLADTLISLGTATGLRTSALLTPMSTPLGRNVGNALEVAEAVRVLRGEGPADVTELTLALAREMIDHCGLSGVDPAEVLSSGRALSRWEDLVRAQGGDPDAELPEAAHVRTVPAPATGWLAALDAYAVGVAASRLGAGRTRKEDEVRHGAGVRCLAKPGERVESGQPLLELHTDTPEAFERALAALEGACEVTDGPVDPEPVVLERRTGGSET